MLRSNADQNINILMYIYIYMLFFWNCCKMWNNGLLKKQSNVVQFSVSRCERSKVKVTANNHQPLKSTEISLLDIEFCHIFAWGKILFSQQSDVTVSFWSGLQAVQSRCHRVYKAADWGLKLSSCVTSGRCRLAGMRPQTLCGEHLMCRWPTGWLVTVSFWQTTGRTQDAVIYSHGSPGLPLCEPWNKRSDEKWRLYS